MNFSLVSVNIERSKHLDRVIPFLQSRTPDVACFQELCEADIETIMAACGAQSVHFSPMSRTIDLDNSASVQGPCIMSKYPMLMSRTATYAGDDSRIPEARVGDQSTYDTANYALLTADIAIQSDTVRVCTTHFLWSPRGSVTEKQRVGMRGLVKELEQSGDFVLTGDFNAPRGGEMFNELASRWKDNIPLQYKTSIDVELHRAGKTHADELATKMVDGLFTTPYYEASEVTLVSGVSDHCAVVADILRK